MRPYRRPAGERSVTVSVTAENPLLADPDEMNSAVRPDRCALTTRFIVGGIAFLAQCTDADGHAGDHTVIDLNTDKPVTAGRRTTNGDPGLAVPRNASRRAPMSPGGRQCPSSGGVTAGWSTEPDNHFLTRPAAASPRWRSAADCDALLASTFAVLSWRYPITSPGRLAPLQGFKRDFFRVRSGRVAPRRADRWDRAH
jgi:hypothetical protein